MLVRSVKIEKYQGGYISLELLSGTSGFCISANFN